MKGEHQPKLHMDSKSETKSHPHSATDAAIQYYYNYQNNMDNSDSSALTFKG
jgi:hypothetical protein